MCDLYFPFAICMPVNGSQYPPQSIFSCLIRTRQDFAISFHCATHANICHYFKSNVFFVVFSMQHNTSWSWRIQITSLWTRRAPNIHSTPPESPLAAVSKRKELIEEILRLYEDEHHTEVLSFQVQRGYYFVYAYLNVMIIGSASATEIAIICASGLAFAVLVAAVAVKIRYWEKWDE